MLLKSLQGSRARIALIDADSVLYAEALSAEKQLDGQYIQTKTIQECLSEVTSRLSALVEAVEADDAIVCLSKGKCFRYKLEANYKSNRIGVRKPPLVEELKDILLHRRKPFGVLAVPGLEADDICSISSTALQRADLREPIIVSIDKDMRCVPGLSYSWMREDDGIVETSETKADYLHMVQTLMGDPVDGYSGCPGIGRAKARKLLDGVADWAVVLDAYSKKGLDSSYALTQARLAYILRDTDWDIIKREISLWLPRGSDAPRETLRLVNVQPEVTIQ